MHHRDEPPDPEIAAKMAELLTRGHEALAAYFARLLPRDRPVGTPEQAAAMIRFVVTREDFRQHFDLCFDYVTKNGFTLHVLCASGTICAVLDKRRAQW